MNNIYNHRVFKHQVETPESFDKFREANVTLLNNKLYKLTQSWKHWIQHAQWNEDTQTLEYAGRTSQFFFDRLSQLTQEDVEDEN